MIHRGTVVYIIILLAVAVFYLFLRNRQPPAEAAATPDPTTNVSYLFGVDEGSPTSILLRAKTGDVVELARNQENAWSLNQPIQAAADQGSSEAVATQVTTMRILERIPKIDPGIVGLKDPKYILTVKFKGGSERTVQVGVVTPTESGYYIQDAAGGDVLVISKSSVDALLRLLTSPPYAETPTPNPDVQETSTPP